MAEYDEEFRNSNPEFREHFRHSDVYPQANIANRPKPQPSWMQRAAKATNPMHFVTNTLPKALAEVSPQLGGEVKELYNDPQRRQDFMMNRVASLLGMPAGTADFVGDLIKPEVSPRQRYYDRHEANAQYDESGRRLHRYPNGVMAPVDLPSEQFRATPQDFRDLFKNYGLHSGEHETGVIGEGLDYLTPFAVNKIPSLIRATPKVLRAGAEFVGEQTPKLQNFANDVHHAARHPFTDVTATMEAVAPDLGQTGGEAFREYITNLLLGGKGAAVDVSHFAGQPTTIRRGMGAWKDEKNPMVAVDVPNIKNISTHNEFGRDMSQVGANLNQEAQAAHRIVPHLFNTPNKADAALIKSKAGDLTEAQFIKLNELLGGQMAFTHNPRLGGAVVFPYDQHPTIPVRDQLQTARQAAEDVLGKNSNFKYGRSDYDKDRFFRLAQDYGVTPNPEISKFRDTLKSLEKNGSVTSPLSTYATTGR